MRRRRDRPLAGATTSALLRNVYTSPSLDYLQRNAPDICWVGDVVSRMRITRLDIQTGITDEGAFIALLAARLEAALDDIVTSLQTFPVHDEPMEL